MGKHTMAAQTQMHHTTAQSAEHGLSVPEERDFESLAEMKALAFAEKSWTGKIDPREIVAVLQQDASTPKLMHSRVYKDESGRVLGGIQLQLPGGSSESGHKLEPGEVYVEYIACHPSATGLGIGSRLLKWADELAKSQGAAFIALDVMKKQGDVVDRFVTGLFVFMALGGKYWTVLNMR